jgi:hypothetical protein
MANASKTFSEQPCPYCGGTGEVAGVVGDVEFIFQCPCTGGSEAAVRWLLGLDGETPPEASRNRGAITER